MIIVVISRQRVNILHDFLSNTPQSGDRQQLMLLYSTSAKLLKNSKNVRELVNNNLITINIYIIFICQSVT